MVIQPLRNFFVAVKHERSLNPILSQFNSAHISITYLLKRGLSTATTYGQPSLCGSREYLSIPHIVC
jgi:hypothetical protein